MVIVALLSTLVASISMLFSHCSITSLSVGVIGSLFIAGFIDPFIIYGFTNILRFISLCLCCRKNCFGGCLYKISDLIPIF